MSLLHRAKNILKSETKSKQILIILLPGKKSLLFRSLLEEFSNRLKADKPNLSAYLLNINDGFIVLRSLIQQILNTTDSNEGKSIEKIMIWPPLLFPSIFQKQSLEKIIREHASMVNIYLIEPLDFEQDIYPFLLKILEVKLI